MLISRSVLICLVNITLKAKSALHILQFARCTVVAIYYTVEALPIQLRSVLICLVNITLTAKSALNTSQFTRPMVHIYYTEVM